MLPTIIAGSIWLWPVVKPWTYDPNGFGLLCWIVACFFGGMFSLGVTYGILQQRCNTALPLPDVVMVERIVYSREAAQAHFGVDGPVTIERERKVQ